jgi:hypothetical protein
MSTEARAFSRKGDLFVNDMTLIEHPDIDSLLEVLRRERQILDLLEDRYWELGALIDSEQDRPLSSAVKRVADVEQHLGAVEMLRALVVAGIAEVWEVPEHDLSLRAIIERSPQERAETLEEALLSFRDTKLAIDRLKASIAEMAKERLEISQRPSVV